MADRIYTGDSAVVEAQLFDEESENVVPVIAVDWYVQRPDGTSLIISGQPPAGVTIGDRVMSRDPTTIDAVAYDPYTVFEWNGTTWVPVPNGVAETSINDDTTAVLVIPGAGTNLDGLYTVRSQFTISDGTQSSTISTFEANDPMRPPATTGIDMAVDHALLKLEDLFDSELGGPWLQDKTVKSFGRKKLKALLPDALYLINNYYQPTTSFDEINFPPNHYPLVSQALLVEAILHLIRSYTEQPLPSGGNISWFDRRDYQARWQSVMTKEEERLNQYIDMFKMEYTGFGATAVLVGGYATPITRMSKYWRMRNPKYIGPYS